MLRIINAALAIVLLIVATAGLTEAQATEPAGSVAGTLYLWVRIAQAVATVIAIVLGGFFAWRRGFIFRHEQPHVTISHDVTHRQIGHGYVHLEVTATLYNSSRVKMEFRDGLFTVEQLAPVAGDVVERLFDEIMDNDLYESPKWDLLRERRLEWGKNELIVEPGEKATATFEYVVSSDVESVLVTTYFYNTRVMGKIPAGANPRNAEKKKQMRRLWRTSGTRGWIRTTAHDINSAGDRLESGQEREGKSDVG